MTFLELLTDVARLVQSDGSATSDAIDIANSSFKADVNKYLKAFSVEAMMIFTYEATLTVTLDSRIGTTSPIVFHPLKVVLNGTNITRSAQDDALSPLVAAESGMPSMYFINSNDTIRFSCPLNAAALTGRKFVDGFSVHPTLSANDDVVQCGVQDEEALAKYIAYRLGEPVASDDISVARLNAYAEFAQTGIARILGRNKARHMRRT
jgi:hypothetical protein